MRSTNKFLSTGYRSFPLPTKDHGGERWDYRPTQEEISDIMERFEGNMDIPHNFVSTAEVTKYPNDPQINRRGRRPSYVCNPQTVELMEKLGIRDKLMEKHQGLRVKNEVKGNGVPYMFGKCKGNDDDDVDTLDDDQIFKWFEKEHVRASHDDEVCGAKILDIRKKDGVNEYLLHFDDLSPFHNEWVSGQNIIGKLKGEEALEKLCVDDPNEIDIEMEDPNEIDIGGGVEDVNDENQNDVDIADPNEIIL